VITVKVEGLDQLLKALEELPKELHKGPLRSAVSAGAKIAQDEARRLAPIGEARFIKVNKQKTPIQPGTLRRAIYRTRSREGSSSVQEMQIVGIRYGKRYQRRGLDAWYWRFIEFGTRRMPGRPFLRPAFYHTHDKQIEALRTRLAKAIATAAAKLRRR
jgi:HK97 gp10 family phage protein